jgi:hypothetical protein
MEQRCGGVGSLKVQLIRKGNAKAQSHKGAEENFTQLPTGTGCRGSRTKQKKAKPTKREEESAQKQGRETELFSPAVWHGAWDPAWQGSNPRPSTKGHVKQHGLLETHP